MPTVAVDREALFERLGKRYTDEEFDDVCFQFGVELDEVMTTAEASGLRQFGGGAAQSGAGDSVSVASASNKVLYYIATPANRTDLLCIEGIARGFNIFLGHIPPPVSPSA
jgi:phenylalanyl-tRNA synthetase beta chain